MPIPEKPLREMLREHMKQSLLLNNDPSNLGRLVVELADAAFNAVAEYDPCFAKAADAGEPTFTLRSQDETADQYVRYWIVDHAHRISPEKFDAANRARDAMRAWPERRLPD